MVLFACISVIFVHIRRVWDEMEVGHSPLLCLLVALDVEARADPVKLRRNDHNLTFFVILNRELIVQLDAYIRSHLDGILMLYIAIEFKFLDARMLRIVRLDGQTFEHVAQRLKVEELGWSFSQDEGSLS